MKGIDDKLKKWARRVRLAKGLRGVAVGGLVGTAFASVLALLDVLGVYYTTWPVMIACWVGGAVLGLLFAAYASVPL